MKAHRAGKLIEAYWPWTASVVSALLSPVLLRNVVLTFETKSRMLEKLVDVCSIGIGFWTMALALLLALESRETIEALKALGLYAKFADYFLLTTYSFFFLLVFCLLTLADFLPVRLSHDLRLIAWSFLLSITFTSMMRSLHLLRKLLKSR